MSGFLKSSEQIHTIDKVFIEDHHKTLRESVSPPFFHCLIRVIHTGGHFPFAQDLRAELPGFSSHVSCLHPRFVIKVPGCLSNQILFFQALNLRDVLNRRKNS